MFLFFEDFKPQNVLILFLFSMKHFYLFIQLRYLNITLEEYIKLYALIEHPIKLQKMTLKVLRSFFCKLTFRRNV